MKEDELLQNYSKKDNICFQRAKQKSGIYTSLAEILALEI